MPSEDAPDAAPERYEVAVAAGSKRSTDAAATRMPHRWTDDGVTVEAPFTGAHLLHVAVAGCVLNDLYREGTELGLAIAGVRVTASGEYDDEWGSQGITYAVDLDTDADPNQVELLLEVVDTVAEIPRAVRAGTTVRRDS